MMSLPGVSIHWGFMRLWALVILIAGCRSALGQAAAGKSCQSGMKGSCK